MKVVISKCYTSVDFGKVAVCGNTYDAQLTGGMNYDGILLDELSDNVRTVERPWAILLLTQRFYPFNNKNKYLRMKIEKNILITDSGKK